MIRPRHAQPRLSFTARDERTNAKARELVDVERERLRTTAALIATALSTLPQQEGFAIVLDELVHAFEMGMIQGRDLSFRRQLDEYHARKEASA